MLHAYYVLGNIFIVIVSQMLEDKLKKGLKMIGEYVGDDDSGLDVDTEALEMEEPIDPEKLSINLKVIKSVHPEISFQLSNFLNWESFSNIHFQCLINPI